MLRGAVSGPVGIVREFCGESNQIQQRTLSDRLDGQPQGRIPWAVDRIVRHEDTSVEMCSYCRHHVLPPRLLYDIAGRRVDSEADRNDGIYAEARSRISRVRRRQRCGVSAASASHSRRV